MILESMVIDDLWFKKTEPESGEYHFFINSEEVTESVYKDRLRELRKIHKEKKKTK